MAKTRVQMEPSDRSDRDELAQLNAPMLPDSPAGIVAQGGTMQQIRGSYATAVSVQRPRQLHEIQKRLKSEAMLCGEDFYYGWGAGDNRIEGPSVKLAMAAARCWGNCAVQMLPVQENAAAYIFTAVFIDLETGFTLERQFRQSKQSLIYGKHDDARKEEMRFAIGQSKACRNVVLNSLPAVLIDQAMKEAKDGVRGRIEEYIGKKGLPAACDLLIRNLAKQGVSEERICEKFKVARKEALGVEELVILKGDLRAIEEGQERAEELFPASGQDKVKEMLEKAKQGQAPAPATATAVSSPPPSPPTEAIPGSQATAAQGPPPQTINDARKEAGLNPLPTPAGPEKKEEVVWATPEQNQQIDDLMVDAAIKTKVYNEKCKELGADPARPTREQAKKIIDWLLGLVNKDA